MDPNIPLKLDKLITITQNVESLLSNLLEEPKGLHFWITTKYGNLVKINYTDLCWINIKDKNTIEIFTENASFLFSSTLSNFEKKLMNPALIRVHNSTIVNFMKAVEININNKLIHVSRNHTIEEIPYSNLYFKTIKQHLNLIKTRV